MAENIEFELDKDQTAEDVEELSTAQRKIVSAPADDKVDSLYSDWKSGDLIVQPNFQFYASVADSFEKDG